MNPTHATNLTSHRAPQSVWDKRGWRGATIEERVAPWLVATVGAALSVYGISRRSWHGAWWIAAGATFIGGAVAGLCDPSGESVRWRRLGRRTDSDPVTLESLDSFPASDAPSSNAGVVVGGNHQLG